MPADSRKMVLWGVDMMPMLSKLLVAGDGATSLRRKHGHSSGDATQYR